MSARSDARERAPQDGNGRPSTGQDLLLEIKGLRTHFFLHEGVVKAVDGVTFEIGCNRTLGVVGESGCGKSVTARSVLQILDRGGKIVDGQILFHRRGHADRATGVDGATGRIGDGADRRRGDAGPFPPRLGERSGKGEPPSPLSSPVVDLARLHPGGDEMRAIRGAEIAMIFQEPMTSFSPVHTIGDQIMEGIILHQKVSRETALQRAIEALRRVGIPRPETRVDAYPHLLSGGMRQRAMIAMALACKPSLLMADEPTTAIDVTTQAQILDLMRELQQEYGMSIMLITHDLGVIAEMVDDVVVMYLGKVVEQGPVDAIFHDPKHPYTQALLRSIPRLGPKTNEKLQTIRGSIPSPYNRPKGCPFHPRCPALTAGVCDQQEPKLIALGERRRVSCWLYSEAGP